MRGITVAGLVATPLLAAAVSMALFEPSHAASGFDLTWRLVVLTVLCALPLAAAAARRIDLLSPLVLVSAYFLLAYALRGWAIHAGSAGGTDVNIRGARAVEGYLAPSLDIATVGVVAFFLGYLCVVAPALGRSIPRPTEPIGRGAAGRAGTVLLAIGVPCTLAATAATRVGSGVFAEFLGNLAAFAMIGLALCFIACERRTISRRVLIAVILILAAATLASTSKAPVLWLILTCAVAYHYGYRRLKIGLLAAGAAIFFLAVFPAVQTVRLTLAAPDHPSLTEAALRLPERLVNTDPRTGQKRSFTPQRYVSDAALLATARLYGTDSLVIARSSTPNVKPFLNGSTYARLPATFVPRVLWPDKPEVSFAQEYAQQYWGRSQAEDRSAQAVGVMGELYLNWGVPAVFVGMLLLGLCYRTWYEWLGRRWTPLAIALYVVSLPTMVQIESDAVLLFRTAVNRVGVAVIALALLGWALSTAARARDVRSAVPGESLRSGTS